VSRDNLKSSTRFETDNGDCHKTYDSVSQFKVVGTTEGLVGQSDEMKAVATYPFAELGKSCVRC
jgi:hypothetical protein